jgi:hypothetical protein
MNEYDDDMIDQADKYLSRNLIQLCWEYVPRPVQGPQESHTAKCIERIKYHLKYSERGNIAHKFVFQHHPLTMNNMHGSKKDYNKSIGWVNVSSVNHFIATTANEIARYFSDYMCKDMPYTRKPYQCILESYYHTAGIYIFRMYELWVRDDEGKLS